MIHAQLFVFFFWGIPQLQSDWNLSCDHAIDYASECENNNNNKYARNSARNMPNIVKETLNTHKSSSSKSIKSVERIGPQVNFLALSFFHAVDTLVL